MTLALTDTTPAFSLPGTDGRTHSLADYADAAALVLIETCNHCPYAQAWEGRISAIQSDYAARGVRVVAISSNDAGSHPEDSFPEMVARAAAKTSRSRGRSAPSGPPRFTSSTPSGGSSTTVLSTTIAKTGLSRRTICGMRSTPCWQVARRP